MRDAVSFTILWLSGLYLFAKLGVKNIPYKIIGAAEVGARFIQNGDP
jgi:hypothetical protein